MTITVTHAFVSTIPDDPSVPQEVRPSNWNADHVVSGLIIPPADEDITTGASPLNLPAPSVSTNYFITTGGTKGVEIINLSAYGSFSESQVGNTALFLVLTLTNTHDQPTLNYYDPSTLTTQSIALWNSVGSPAVFSAFILECDGQNWFPQNWWNKQALPSGFQSHAEGQAIASGPQSHAEGNATASARYAHAESSSTASGLNSHAEGNLTVASSAGDHAEGQSTTASGGNSHAEGNGGTASGSQAHVEGEFCVADNIDCQATGSDSWCRGIYVSQAYSSGMISVTGDNQVIRMGLRQQTTDATSSLLTADQSLTGSLSNQLTLIDNETAFVEVVVVGKTAGAADILAQRIEVMIQRGTGAASTAIPTTTPTSPVVISHYATAGAISGAWAVSLSADATNGALSITVTGQAATTINWTAELRSRELVF